MLLKLRVGILCGGCSKEHEISLQSATYIANIIDKNRFEIVMLWINKNGDWYVINNKYNSFFSNPEKNEYIPILLRHDSNRLNFKRINSLLKLDIIFPVTHGTFGEDGSLQGFLNIINLPYVGSDVLGSAICINKDITKSLLRDSGLPITSFRTFSDYEYQKINFHDLVAIFGLPFFIKPVNQGSSIGVSWVNNINNFHTALDIAFSCSKKIIIESCIIGRELECAIIGGNDIIESSVCGEIIVKNNNLYTYHDKYIKHNAKIVIPAVIDVTISNKIRHIAINAFQILNCFGMARVDLFLIQNNKIIINEVNTIPGFTNNSMYLKLWEVTGFKPQLLITKLIELSFYRYKNVYYTNNDTYYKK